MINSLTLRNFQNHKASRLEFKSGVNVIIGPSRQGKTAILRALRWLVENRPAGDAFIRHGSGPEGVEVSLELSSGQVITRVKSKSDNYYDLNGEPFRGFGQDVPAPVSTTINLSPINYQAQFDSPFLIFDSPGEVARTLNKIVNLEVIDRALAAVASMARKNSQEIASHESRLMELRELEDQFPDLESAEEFILELEQIESTMAGKLKNIEKLNFIRGQLAKLKNEFKRYKVPDGFEASVNILINKKAESDQKNYTLWLLKRIQGNLSVLNDQASTIRPMLLKHKVILGLIELNRAIQAKKKVISKIKAISDSIKRGKEALIRKTTIIGQRQAELNEMMPPECPLCGQEIK